MNLRGVDTGSGHGCQLSTTNAAYLHFIITEIFSER